jgi:uncharacterized lipoprotein NlpE involved in copper resistance
MKKVIFILLIAFTLFGCESQQDRTNVTNPRVALDESRFISDTLTHGYYKTQWKDGSKYIYYYNKQKEFLGRDEIFVNEPPFVFAIFIGFLMSIAVVGLIGSIIFD